MKEQLINQINAYISEYMAKNSAFSILSDNGCKELVDYVDGLTGHFLSDDLAYDEMCCLIAMIAVGPIHDGLPPVDMREQLLGLVRQYSDENLRIVAEIVVAYGCGNWRQVDSSSRGWSGEWDRAVLALIDTISYFIRAVNTWLSDRVLGYPDRGYWNSFDGRMMSRADAAFIAVKIMRSVSDIELSEGQSFELDGAVDGMNYRVSTLDPDHTGPEGFIPPGGRLVFVIRSENCMLKAGDDTRMLVAGTRVVVFVRDGETRISFEDLPPGMKVTRITLKGENTASIHGPLKLQLWECACGHEKCMERHRLAAWKPSHKVSLRSFLASAVKGPQPSIMVGSLSVGMYFPMLSHEGGARGLRVRMGPVEYVECADSGCVQESGNHYHQGDSCPRCKTRFDERQARRKAFNHLFIDGLGMYELKSRIHCAGVRTRNGSQKKCGNLYSTTLQECPVCGCRPKLRRPTMVWVCTFTRHLGGNVIDRIGEYDGDE